MVSGNGQVVREQFRTNIPLLVQARGPQGTQAAGVPVTWSITQGQGTLVERIETTDASGLASATFVGTGLQPGASFLPATVTASSSFGTVSFVVTTSALRNIGGTAASPPAVELIAPPLDNRNLSGRAGSTIPGAIMVRVIALSGFQVGQGVPNVGIRIVNTGEADPATSPSGVCNGPEGLALTDSTGVARCDLTLNSIPGTVRIAGLVGEYQYTPGINLEITPGAACSYALSPGSQSLPAAGGSGNVGVTTLGGCTWSAVANASWIAVTSGASGTGAGNAGYTVGANSGPARTGTLTIGGQTFTITQAAAGSVTLPLTISTSASLPGAQVGAPYSAALIASGGRAPYTWALTGTLPVGITLNSTGILSGSPTAAGAYGFTARVTDANGASVSQTFTLGVTAAGGGGGGGNALRIANLSFPNGGVGQEYRQVLNSTGGCPNPFGPVPAFTLASGALPPGLTVGLIADRTYGISGTPTTNGAYSFALKVTDTCGASTSNFTLTVGTGGGIIPALGAAPGAITFSTSQGSSTAPAPKSIAVSSGTTAVDFTASSSVPWLGVTRAGRTPAQVAVSLVNHAALAAGTYEAFITISANTGGASVVVPVTLTVTPGVSLGISPASIAVTHNGSLTTQQSLTLTSPAAVRFTASASTVGNSAWLAINSRSPETPTTADVSISSAGLSPGSYLGSITITPVGGNPQQIPVSLTVTQPAALTISDTVLRFTTSTGSEQAITVGSTGGPLNFRATTAGSLLTVTPTNGTTPATIKVAVNTAGLAPGVYAGGITFYEESTGLSAPLLKIVTVLITVTEPLPAIDAVTNAASFLPGPVAPGELVTIFGSNLGPATLATAPTAIAGVVPKSLADTRVLFDGIQAPILYTSAGQLSAIVPYTIGGRATTRLQVAHRGTLSNSIELNVVQTAPGVFTLDASGQGAIVNQDGTVNSQENRAEPGSIVSIYATGEGQTEPGGEDGSITKDVLAHPKGEVAVTINGENAELHYAGSAPGLPAGVMQVNAIVPMTVPRGARVEVRVRVGSAVSQSGVTMAIKP